MLDKIRSVIVREVGCEEKDVVLDACWRDDLGADSLDMAYVMMEVDKLLEIHIDENDGWDKNSTLYETCSGIVRTLGEAAGLIVCLWEKKEKTKNFLPASRKFRQCLPGFVPS